MSTESTYDYSQDAMEAMEGAAGAKIDAAVVLFVDRNGSFHVWAAGPTPIQHYMVSKFTHDLLAKEPPCLAQSSPQTQPQPQTQTSASPETPPSGSTMASSDATGEP